MRRFLTGWFFVLSVLWLAIAFAEPAFRIVNFDLRSVHVSDVDMRGQGAVSVDRVIRRDVDLEWSVTIQERASGTSVCTPSQTKPFPYSTKANATNPLNRRFLWLIGGKSAWDDCVSAGLRPGLHRLTVCHYRYVLWVACTSSNWFWITEDGAGQ